MKLNLGCGTNIRPGWLNLDARKMSGVDVVHELHPDKPLPFADNTFDELVARDFLEHFKKNDTGKLLRDWYRVLKPNGCILIAVPHIEQILRLWSQGKVTISKFSELLYGKQDYEFNCHYQCFNKDRLREVLEEAGFKDIKIREHLKKRQYYGEGIK